MLNLTKSFKDKFLYASVGEKEFKETYPHVEQQILHDNLKNLVAFSLLATILFFIMAVASFLSAGLSQYRALYIISFLVSVITWFSSRRANFKVPFYYRLSTFLYILFIFLFAILLGTVYSPNELSATYIVMIIAAPLVFVDKPKYFALMTLVGYVIFVSMALIFKNPDCLVSDLTNVTVFSIFSVISCVYTMNIKFMKYSLEYKNKVASETDILTGLRNRLCYEYNIGHFPQDQVYDAFFVYVDANGLHERNDTEGHEAGDKMLQCIASIMKQEFGDKTFRIGGDEFVTFGSGMEEDDVAYHARRLSRAVSKNGYSVSVGYAMGHEDDTLPQLTKRAEKMMYDEKAKYYSDPQMNRRNR